MSEAYVGEIRIFAGARVPDNWMACNGQLLNVNEYQILYSLIGNTYGSNGSSTFALPNLQGRLVVGAGQGQGLPNNYQLGQTAGSYEVALTNQNTAHSHNLMASSTGASALAPTNAVFATVPSGFVAYVPSNANGIAKTSLDSDLLASSGGNAAHPNIMPSVAVQYIICVNGIYPDFN